MYCMDFSPLLEIAMGCYTGFEYYQATKPQEKIVTLGENFSKGRLICLPVEYDWIGRNLLVGVYDEFGEATCCFREKFFKVRPDFPQQVRLAVEECIPLDVRVKNKRGRLLVRDMQSVYSYL